MNYLERNFREIEKIAKTEIPGNVILAFVLAFIGGRFIPPAPLAVIIAALLFSSLNTNRAIFLEQQEVKKIQEERKELIEKIETSDNVVDVIQLSLNQITEYYTINKNQARQSFGYSATLVFAGFVAIAASILLPFFQEEQKIEVSIIAGVSGVILQFIGGAVFVLYNKTIEQSNRFYEQLTRIQDTMLAVELCKQIKDDNKNAQLMEKLITTLIERSSRESQNEPRKRVPARIKFNSTPQKSEENAETETVD